MTMQSLELEERSWLAWFYRGLLVFFGLLLLGRVCELQVVKGNYYRALAENNRIRRNLIPAPRGRIIARGGEVLVGNREVNGKLERDYAFGADFAHVSGYLAEADEAEVRKVDGRCIEKGIRNFGTLVGRSGLEAEYECRLRGVNGEELVEVDALGEKLGLLV
jgi:cell division protein FtsI/penicillin-binding protein 2